ncbi:AtpZ/AtpI family protein [Candidatus Peregrinibacteria bacterium]|nr:AtpZ/AtpI family protein [Candidatus Peregrinibacteria bacterium]
MVKILKKAAGGADKNVKAWTAYQLAMNLGYMIVLPILAFAIGGVLLDKYFDSFPIFIFTGFLLAMVSGLTVVYIKTKDIIVQGVGQGKSSKNNK